MLRVRKGANQTLIHCLEETILFFFSLNVAGSSFLKSFSKEIFF